MKYIIYPIPYEIHGPPYLELLYGKVKGRDVEGDEFSLEPFSWKKVLLTRPKENEKRVVHIHWPTNIYGSEYVLVSLVRGGARFIGLWILRLFGTKIIWTMHNMHGHDYPHPWIDTLGQWLMWHTANKVIIQERTFAASEKARRESKKIVCIPPGNYIDVYGPVFKGDKETLRKQYGLEKDDIVLLSIGSIRPYKALPEVIDVFNAASKANAKLRLLIAGKANKEYSKIILKHINNNPRITIRPEYIPDEKLPDILALADYTICYYTDSALGSAAIMVSLSYGVPVITRDFPASELVIQDKGGYVFHEDEELVEKLTKLNRSNVIPESVIDTVRTQDWKQAGMKIQKAYKNLWK